MENRPEYDSRFRSDEEAPLASDDDSRYLPAGEPDDQSAGEPSASTFDNDARWSRRRRARRRRVHPALLVTSVLGVLGLLFLAAFVGYELMYRERVILGVSASGQSLSGLTRVQAGKLLQDTFGTQEAILQRAGGEPIVLRDGDRTWRAMPWELGLRTDFGPVADSALLLGHRGSFLENLIEQARCFWLGCDLGADAQFDTQTAQAYLAGLAKQVERAPRDASVRVEAGRAVSLPGQTGRTLDSAVVLERMRLRLSDVTPGDVPLAFRETPPAIANADAARTQAEAIVSAPVLLTFGSRSWALDQATLAAMVQVQLQAVNGNAALTVTLDHAQMVAFLKLLTREINQPARDARFHFNPTTKALTPTVTSQYGQTLDPETAAKQIEQALLAPKAPGSASPLNFAAGRAIALPVTLLKPNVAMEDAGKFGIKELAAQGVSNFKGSPAGRVQNIRTAAAQFDGVVIPPGGTFSFNEYLGDVVEANGYDDAYVIFQDRTVLGPGGGVCQVSTTMFRAAFWGGYPIVERWAHSYRVGYYEPPVGLDATVFSPTVDFKFKNDTDNYILIEPIFDAKKTTLTFNFYGTKPNRTVTMQDPIQEKVIPHGPAIYTNDPTIKKGVTKQVDTAHDGMDVTIWRTITVNGQAVKKEKFFSRYQPWVARYLVGTKE